MRRIRLPLLLLSPGCAGDPVDDWNEEGLSIVGPDGEAGPTAQASPAAVSGRLTAWARDAATGVGTVAIEAAPGVSESAPPPARYPSGATVTITDEGCSAWHAEAVRVDGSGPVLLRFEPAS